MNSIYACLTRSFNGFQKLAIAGLMVAAVPSTDITAQSVASASGLNENKLGAMSSTRISYPASAAPGSTIEIKCVPVTGARSYTWTATSGVLINGHPSPVTTRSPKATLTLGVLPQGQDYFEFCVYASNSNEISNAACKQISSVATDAIYGQEISERLINDSQIQSAVFPNPADNELTVSATVEDEQAVKLTLTDLTGRIVMEKHYHAVSGSNNWTLEISSIPQGYYILSLVTESGFRQDLKISVY